MSPRPLPRLRRASAAGTCLLLLLFGLAACGENVGRGSGERPPAPVELAPIEQGAITLRRNLSGSLRAQADFTVGARVAGQVRELKARVADPITRGETLAQLEDEPFVQEIKRAEAELLVAEAHRVEAEAQSEITARAMQRTRELREQGIASETQFDTALAAEQAAIAALAVAKAEVARAEAALEAARIRQGYTEVRADWTEGDDSRVVAERFVDEGDIVGVNQRMFRVVELDPLIGVVQITERDYPYVRAGDPVRLRVASYPEQPFTGRVQRVAPVFSELSRQAQVEFEVPNTDGRLRPGMFVQAELVLEQRQGRTIVPLAAIVRRDATNGVFVASEDQSTVQWHAVRLGIREGERVELLAPELTGEVVVLGQQLLEDGSRIRVTENARR